MMEPTEGVETHNRRSANARRTVRGLRTWSRRGVRLHVDHVVPVSKGGQDKMDTLVIACGECHLGKADRMPQA